MDSISTEQFLETIKNLDRRISGLERTTQPQLIDWYEMNPSLFTYSSDNVLTLDDSLVTAQFFQMGDKIRINQSGYKYFYIIEVDYTAKTITLNAGDDYTLTNATFTSFGFSRIANPLEFPQVFTYEPNIYSVIYPMVYDDTLNYDGVKGARQLYFSMTGCFVTISFSIVSYFHRVDTTGIIISTPFVGEIPVIGANIMQSTGLMSMGGTSTGDIYFYSFVASDFGMTTPVNIGIGVNPLGGGTFNSGDLSMAETLTGQLYSTPF